jgi:hypothetical protein
VKQHLGRQSGVQKVEVSLIDGKVDITPKEDGQINPAQLLKATFDSGVTAEEMDVVARGRIAKGTLGSLALQLGQNQSFEIAPNQLSETLESLADTPTMVTVRGQLYKKPVGKGKMAPSTSLKLLILEVQRKE